MRRYDVAAVQSSFAGWSTVAKTKLEELGPWMVDTGSRSVNPSHSDSLSANDVKSFSLGVGRIGSLLLLLPAASPGSTNDSLGVGRMGSLLLLAHSTDSITDSCAVE